MRRSANATAQAQSPLGVMRCCRLRTAHVVSTMSGASVRLTKRADAPQVCERAGLHSKTAMSEPERTQSLRVARNKHKGARSAGAQAPLPLCADGVPRVAVAERRPYYRSCPLFVIEVINSERSEHEKALNSAKISKHYQTLCNPCYYSVCAKILVIWTAVILDGILTKKRTAGYGSFEFSNLLRLFLGENCFTCSKPQTLPCPPFSLLYLPLSLLPTYLTQSSL